MPMSSHFRLVQMHTHLAEGHMEGTMHAKAAAAVEEKEAKPSELRTINVKESEEELDTRTCKGLGHPKLMQSFLHFLTDDG